jgi:hypothetical protein
MKPSYKKAGLISIALAVSSAVFAGGVVKKHTISSDYSRNSVTKIAVAYGDKWDNHVITGIDSIDTGSKFDVNVLRTKTIHLEGAFRTAEEQQQAAAAATSAQSSGNSAKAFFAGIGDAFKGLGKGGDAKPDTLTQRLLTEYININNVGKEIFDYVLMVDNNGRFHPNIMVERSRWNATDKDVKLDNASQVKRMDSQGEALLANSYIIVFDAKDPKIGETTDSNGKKKPLYTANVTGYVFMVDSAADVINNILHNMWIEDNDDTNSANHKRELYRDVHIPMICVAAQSVSASSNESMRKAITNSYDGVLRKLENKISAWEVTATPEDVRPYITAKVGKKEGIKNAQRFKIYKNYETTNKEGRDTTYTKKVGFARATVINDNETVADGNTGVSYFYQISGRRMKGTEFLKQSNDIRLGLSIDYNYNGLGWENQKIFGAFSMVDITFDYLAYMHKNGISHYARINVGYDIVTSKMLKNGYTAINSGATEAQAESALQNTWLEKGVSFVNISAGYACGLKVKQVMEFQPMINVGVDLPVFHAKVDLTKDQKKKNYGVFIDPALRIIFNCGYPFQLFVQADYSVMVLQGATYKDLNGDLDVYGHKRDMGLGVAAGMKWTF